MDGFSNGAINRVERKQNKKKCTKKGGSDLHLVKLVIVQLVKKAPKLKVLIICH